jgi:riboflavin synthase
MGHVLVQFTGSKRYPRAGTQPVAFDQIELPLCGVIVFGRREGQRCQNGGEETELHKEVDAVRGCAVATLELLMFTGIIEELGTVVASGSRLTVRCDKVLEDLGEGASIAVNGVCLTAIGIERDSFSADLAPETLRRTNLGDLQTGAPVNLERPVTPATRLSGHIVQGHVDGTGELLALDSLGADNWWLRVRIPAELERYLVFKGSIAIDGISLTIASLDRDELAVAIIPHTYANTTLGGYQPGARVNLECDVLAKHAEKLMASLAGLSH